MIHTETKKIVRKMLNSGFRREEFSCRVERSLGCIKDIHIYVKDINRITEQEKYILRSNLGILRVITKNGNIHQTIKAYTDTGEITLIDHREDK